MNDWLRLWALYPICFLLWGLSSQSLGQAENPARLRGSGQVKRSVLTYKQLMRGSDSPAPVDETAAFALPLQAAEPTESFEGALTLTEGSNRLHFTLLSDVFRLISAGDSPWKHVPPFHFHFVQTGSFLIPAEQGLSITGDPAWNYIVGPGRVWRELGDAGYMRASLPFALVQRNQNCVHNGVVSFLFSTTRSPRISRAFYQITQETCFPMKFDMWGELNADFAPGAVAAAPEVRARSAAERARHIPTKPIRALAEDFPRTGIDLASIKKAYKHPDDITTYGFVLRGVHYSSGCPGRSGEYPFCDEMRLPSYSIAKSVFAGVALMRLGQLYGTSVYDLRIKDYVPDKDNEGDWEKTTLGNASDMATGNFNSDRYEADEDSSVNDRFLIAESLEAKTRDAFAFHAKYATPGTTWVYQSPATFLLTQAMQVYLRQKRGPGADIFNLVRDDVYQPLHMSQGFMSTIRTENSPAGAPTGYYGLFFNKDDVAKISTFLNSSSGKLNGEQVLEPSRLAEALFRGENAGRAGVPILGRKSGSALGEALTNKSLPGSDRRYAHGFWGAHMARAQSDGPRCDYWISLMNGYGGNIVMLLPNGVTFYIFTDSAEFPWAQPLSIAAKLAPMCN